MLPVAGPSSVEPNLPLLDSNLGFDEADVGSLQSRPSSSSLFADLASYLDKRLLPLHNEMRCLSNKVASLKRPRSDPHHHLPSALDLRPPLLAPWGDLLRPFSPARLLVLHSLELLLFRSTLPINQKNRSTPSPSLIIFPLMLPFTVQAVQEKPMYPSRRICIWI